MKTAPGRTLIPLHKIRISDHGFHLHIRAEIHGQPCLLTVDTGASDTVFDTLVIEQLVQKKSRLLRGRLSAGLGTTEMQSRRIVLDSLRLGRLVIPGQKFTCLDLSNLNISYETIGVPQVAGVLGSDILSHFGAVIHYGRMRLSLSLPENSTGSFAKSAYFSL